MSTEANKVVSARAVKLNIECLQGLDNKRKSLNNFCDNNKISLENVLFIGNDINDKELNMLKKHYKKDLVEYSMI